MTQPEPQPEPPVPDALPLTDVQSRRGIVRRWFRLEVLLFGLAFWATFHSKLVIAWRNHADNIVTAVGTAILPDLAFFAMLAALCLFIARFLLPGIAVRVVLLLLTFIAAWSALNAAWLIGTSVQIQPSVVQAALLDLEETRLIVVDTFQRRMRFMLVPSLIGTGMLFWIAWRLFRPAAHLPRSLSAALKVASVAILPALAAIALDGGPTTAVWRDSIGFSSHWHALERVAYLTRIEDGPAGGRHVPRAGEQQLGLPPEDAPRPNVLIVFLESVSNRVTSFGNPEADRTPVLRQLAEEGVTFVTTRVNMPHTTKGFWSGLTGMTPEIRYGAVESVLMDTPYESLATALRPRGYRSAFFEMSRGAFEGAPGLFSNLGFDYAWFRENLEDPSTHLGWTNGDDRRVIAPMFEWIDAQDQPFLAGMITTISHDPYELPEWWEEPPHANDARRYGQSVQCGDVVLGEILAQLDARGLRDNTIVCVIGDHGEVFRKDSGRGRYCGYDDAIRVPWVLRWPGHIPAGQRIESPCAQIDLTPTLLALMGYDLSNSSFDGMDALGPIPDDRPLYFQAWYDNSPTGVVIGSDKYIIFPAADRVLRFAMDDDPDELNPQRVDAATAERIRAEVDAWTRSTWINIPARRSRSTILYGAWRTVSTGRNTTAYYLTPENRPAPAPDPPGNTP